MDTFELTPATAGAIERSHAGHSVPLDGRYVCAHGFWHG